MDQLSISPELSSTDNSSNAYEWEKNLDMCNLFESLDVESARVKRAIRKKFEYLRQKMDTTDEMLIKNVEENARIALGCIRDGTMASQSQFFFELLIQKFEKISLEIGENAKKIVNENNEEILKTIAVHYKRVKKLYVPRRKSQKWKVTKEGLELFYKFCLLSLIVVILVVFPDYNLSIVNKIFESTFHAFQTVILIFFIFIAYSYYFK
ncbi:uncharacterized protein NPIL_120441 [Nephila pilipes]|uniref:Uncharacterized protein n=1 Tax=Nephila pilipes TaxID=299642 RepID=A0A8X6NJR6_NEPPI|nr:uncharacterized protein NPIL_120441 [Nephila pilipes]